MALKQNHLIFVLICTLSFAIVLPLAAEQNRPKVAVVLEGGGAWGFAHVGVLKVMEELGIPVDMVVGTSMGSIVGGLYASGYTATEIETIADNADWDDLFFESDANAKLNYMDNLDRAKYGSSIQFDRKGVALSGGLLSGNKVLRFFDLLLINVPSPTDFDALPRRFRAVATDVLNGDRIIYSNGSLPDAMRASMSIPGVFSAFPYDGHFLVDGGLVDNLPVNVARSMGADIIIAVDLYDGKQVTEEELNRSPITSLTRSIDIALRENIKRQLPGADLVVAVDISGLLPTDFAKARLISKRGEDRARIDIGKLKAVKERLGNAEITPILKQEIPLIQRVVVEGSSARENAKVAALFEPLVGTNPDSVNFARPFSILDQTGKYELVRVHRDSTQQDKPLIVKLREKKPKKNELKLGLRYSATCASAVTGSLDIMPAVMIHGLTTTDSQLRIEGRPLDTPEIAIWFVQPIGSYFSVTPRYAYEQESLSQLYDSVYVVTYQTAKHTAGLTLDFLPFASVDASLGWHYDNIVEQEIPLVLESSKVTTASIIETALNIRRIDSPVFPMDGIDMRYNVKVSVPTLGSDRFFRVFQTEGSTFLSLGTPFSIALLWKGGSDFSKGGVESTAAPPIYKPTISSRRMFPGPLATDEEIGSHAGAFGIEIKHNINWSSKGVMLPVFTIYQASFGEVIQDASAIDDNNDAPHEDVAAGLGIRVNDSFGIEFRCGAHGKVGSAFTPFIAFDIGSIGL